MPVIQTGSAEETRATAAVLAKTLASGDPHPFIIGLSGDLGSGKTTFIQGFARALGIKRRLLSPTFLIMRSYRLPRARAGYRTLFHLDAYRLQHGRETAALGFQKVVRDPANIVLVEWAGNIGAALPKNSIWIDFKHGRRENERFISLRNTK